MGLEVQASWATCCKKVADADGRDQDGQRWGLTQRAVGEPLDRHAQQRADDHATGQMASTGFMPAEPKAKKTT